MVVTSASMVLGLDGVGGASVGHRDAPVVAKATGTQPVVRFTFTITGLPAGKILTVIYADGADGGKQTAENSVSASSGGIGVIKNLTNGFVLGSTSTGALNATVEDTLEIEPGKLDGTITLPAGTTAALTNEKTKQTIQLSSGSFSIPTGA